MALALYVVIAVVSLALISSLSVFLHVSPLEVNPILILIAYINVHDRMVKALVYSLFLGAILDILSGYTLGMNMLVCGAVSMATHYLVKAGMTDRGFSMFLLVAPLSLLYHFLLLLLLRAFLSYGDSWTLSSVVWLACLNATIAWVFRPLLHRTMTSLGLVERVQNLRERISSQQSNHGYKKF